MKYLSGQGKEEIPPFLARGKHSNQLREFSYVMKCSISTATASGEKINHFIIVDQQGKR